MPEHFFALVLQNSISKLNVASVVESIRRLSAPIGLSVNLLSDVESEGPVLLEIGGSKISILAKPSRVPTGTMEKAAYASIGWPDANNAIKDHQAHIIVGCVDRPSDHEQALHYAVLTTLATEAVCRLSEGTGIYWSTGQIMVSAETWQRATASILEKNLPVEDWINLYWIKDEKEILGAVTEGARAFFGMEIEFAPAPLQPADIAGRLFGLVRYLLMNGQVLKDGDTLGQNEAEIIRVRFKKRGMQFEGRVIELSFEQQPPKLPGLGGTPYSSTIPTGSKHQTFAKQRIYGIEPHKSPNPVEMQQLEVWEH